MSDTTLKLIKDNDVKWVDLRFTDPRGKEQHTTIPASNPVLLFPYMHPSAQIRPP